ncbi:hypothetical protein HNP49_003118 [Pseudomonas fluvialis]|uniref:Uncharacterized protein n=1 Tax=Pseudomonas fluvialis TaxID=1793966 RepID=A0A7X0BW48_9PSED|nr:hypothetical protein [Pseudomonas fluvialis]MBB6342930.1 hypothetical protein [Pseudomonas fluvialis]
MSQQDMTVLQQFCQASEWNRFALPEQFRGCVDHTPALINHTGNGQGLQHCIDNLLKTPFTDMVLGELSAGNHVLALLEALNHSAPDVMPWLENPRLCEIDTLRRLTDSPARFGLQLHLLVDREDCQSSSQQLERLLSLLEQLPDQPPPLCLLLRDAPGASTSQLQTCIELARQFRFTRITLCDEQARLTPLGTGNLFSHLGKQLNSFADSKLSLGFMAGNRHGLAIVNSMSAIANGAHFIHGSIVAGTNTLGLSQLLQNYATPDQQDICRYAEAISQLTGLPPDGPGLSPTRLTSSVPASSGVPLLSDPLLSNSLLNNPLPEHHEQPRFIFHVSADDWHVRLQIEQGAQRLDLGERVHHYVLLLLAREFCQQQEQRWLNGNSSYDPLSLGWIERECLHKMIGDSDTQLNVKIFRAIKQISCALASADLPTFKPVLTRVGCIRFACPNFTIFKDSSLEYDVRGWTRLNAHAATSAVSTR